MSKPKLFIRLDRTLQGMLNFYRFQSGGVRSFPHVPDVSDDDLVQGLFYYVENPKAFFIKPEPLSWRIDPHEEQEVQPHWYPPSTTTWSWARNDTQVGEWLRSKLIFIRMENDLTTVIHLLEKLTRTLLIAETERRLVWRSPDKERRRYYGLDFEGEKYYELNLLLEKRYGRIPQRRDTEAADLSHYNFPYVKEYVERQGWNLEVVA